MAGCHSEETFPKKANIIFITISRLNIVQINEYLFKESIIKMEVKIQRNKESTTHTKWSEKMQFNSMKNKDLRI